MADRECMSHMKKRERERKKLIFSKSSYGKILLFFVPIHVHMCALWQHYRKKSFFAVIFCSLALLHVCIYHPCRLCCKTPPRARSFLFFFIVEMLVHMYVFSSSPKIQHNVTRLCMYVWAGCSSTVRSAHMRRVVVVSVHGESGEEEERRCWCRCYFDE